MAVTTVLAPAVNGMAMVPLNTTSQPMTAPPQDKVVLKASLTNRDSRGLFSTWLANCAGAMYFCASRTMMRLGRMLQIGLNSRRVTTLKSASIYTTPAPTMPGSASMMANNRGRSISLSMRWRAMNCERLESMPMLSRGLLMGGSSLKSWGLDLRHREQAPSHILNVFTHLMWEERCDDSTCSR